MQQAIQQQLDKGKFYLCSVCHTREKKTSVVYMEKIKTEVELFKTFDSFSYLFETHSCHYGND